MVTVQHKWRMPDMNLAIDNYRINPESQVMLADWAGDDDGGLDK
mgnify:CR=1 FL=1